MSGWDEENTQETKFLRVKTVMGTLCRVFTSFLTCGNPINWPNHIPCSYWVGDEVHIGGFESTFGLFLRKWEQHHFSSQKQQRNHSLKLFRRGSVLGTSSFSGWELVQLFRFQVVGNVTSWLVWALFFISLTATLLYSSYNAIRQ